MKTIQILLMIPLLFILIGMAGCEDDGNETYPDAIIIGFAYHRAVYATCE